MTAAAMFALAAGKARTALGNPVLRTEGRVTTIDGILACALLGPHPQRRRRIVVGRPRRRIRARLLRRPRGPGHLHQPPLNPGPRVCLGYQEVHGRDAP